MFREQSGELLLINIGRKAAKVVFWKKESGSQNEITFRQRYLHRVAFYLSCLEKAYRRQEVYLKQQGVHRWEERQERLEEYRNEFPRCALNFLVA
jgi:hypothetical protein